MLIDRKNTTALATFIVLLCFYLSPLASIFSATDSNQSAQLIGSIQTKVLESEYDEIVFVGDLLLARDVEKLQRQLGYDYPFIGVRKSWLNSFVVVNFEASIPEDHQPTPLLDMTFSVDTSALDSLVQAGVTHTGLANNHSFDYGKSGYENTLGELTRRNFTAFGAPRNAIMNSVIYETVGDHQLAILAFEAVDKNPSSADLEKLLAQASAGSDFQIVYVHWGVEYETKHSRQQQALAKELIDFGADLIVGHHPHVVQDVGWYDGVPIFYSLGNFVFDQYFNDDVQFGLQVRLVSSNDKLSLELEPVTSIDTKAQPQLLEAEQKADWLSDLAMRSAPDLRQAIIDGVIDLP